MCCGVVGLGGGSGTWRPLLSPAPAKPSLRGADHRTGRPELRRAGNNEWVKVLSISRMKSPKELIKVFGIWNRMMCHAYMLPRFPKLMKNKAMPNLDQNADSYIHCKTNWLF